jgi:hypothetical protein
MEMKELFHQIQHLEEEEMDDLCNQLKKKTNVFYDERKELESFFEKDCLDLEDLKESDERYKRYLDGIQVWKSGRKSFEHIRDNIQNFLNLKSTVENMHKKMKLMRIIDEDLMGILLNKK